VEARPRADGVGPDRTTGDRGVLVVNPGEARYDHARAEDARAFHRSTPVVDGHADSILGVLAVERTLVARSDRGHLDFPRARDGGLSATIQAAWPAPATYSTALVRVTAQVEAIRDEIDRSEGRAVLARCAADIDDAFVHGRLAVLIDVEGAEALHGDLAVFRSLYRAGVRVFQPVWNHRNAAADGVEEEDRGGGLSAFGRALVAEANRLGVAIDLSHIVARGFDEAIDLSAHPVLFTHGNCRALFDHRRNLRDDQIRRLAERGGVFGISYVATFMGEGEVTVSHVADHVDHAVQVAGPHHVGLGSDWDGTDLLPRGLESAELLPNLTAELMARGYGREDLQAILGGNYLRAFRQIYGA